MIRISPPWLKKSSTRRVVDVLADAGHAVFFVGGCVRNALLDVQATDIDIATDARPERVMELAEAAGLRAVPTGIAHGTATIIADGAPYEVTTFRRDVATDGRRATVEFSSNIEEDAVRRDFTMNALYADPQGGVRDPIHGLDDLSAGRVRFVGDPARRIAEDYLRILRFFRFHAWYGAPEVGMDADGLSACSAARAGLDGLSRERVGAEINKLLAAPDPEPALAAMEACGVLGSVLSGALTRGFGDLIAAEIAAGAESDWRRRLLWLGDASGWVEALRLSRADRRALTALTEAVRKAGPPAAEAYRFGGEVARSAAIMRAAKNRQRPPPNLEAEILRGIEARFPLRGGDLDATGPELGATLRRLEDAWIASNFSLSAEELKASAKA